MMTPEFWSTTLPSPEVQVVTQVSFGSFPCAMLLSLWFTPVVCYCMELARMISYKSLCQANPTSALSVVWLALFLFSQIFWLKNRAPDQWADTIQNKFTIESINKLSDTQLLDEIRKDQDISSQVSGVLPMQSQTQSQDQTWWLRNQWSERIR